MSVVSGTIALVFGSLYGMHFATTSNDPYEIRSIQACSPDGEDPVEPKTRCLEPLEDLCDDMICVVTGPDTSTSYMRAGYAKCGERMPQWCKKNECWQFDYDNTTCERPEIADYAIIRLSCGKVLY